MSARPHICLVLPNIYPVLANRGDLKFVGGAELQHSIAARIWVRMGLEVSVVCLDHGQPENEIIDGIRVIKAYPPKGGLPGLRFFHPRLTGLWAACRRADADLYYQPCADYRTGVLAAFCRRYRRRSVFAGASDTDFRLDSLRLASARDRWLYRWGLRRVDAIVAQTERQRDLCRQQVGRAATVIPNAYDLPYARPRPRQDYVLWVGGIRPVKRPDRFLDLARQMPHVRFRMIGGPVGDGESGLAYYERIKAAAAIIPNLDFLGFIPYAETEPHFDHASLFVNTSEVEGFPNTFLQAWARGLPTISFFDPVLTETGIYRQVTTMVEAVAAVLELSEPSPARDALAARCLSYVQRHHGTATIQALYQSLFSQLLDGGEA